jgi:energy-coupling factor transport system substrate-specific component
VTEPGAAAPAGPAASAGGTVPARPAGTAGQPGPAGPTASAGAATSAGGTAPAGTAATAGSAAGGAPATGLIRRIRLVQRVRSGEPRVRAARPRAVRIRARSAAALVLASAVGLLGFGWPLLVEADSSLGHSADAPWLFAALLLLLLAVVLAEIADGGMDAKAVALLGVLAAIGAALRPLGPGAAGIEPMFFLLVLAGRVLGRGFGFVLGALTLFASALLTAGVGPWLPFQMLGAAWFGFGAGCLPRAVRGRAEMAMLAGYGMLASLAYGLALNLSIWPFLAGVYGQDSEIAFAPGAPLAENLGRLVAFTAATSLAFDIPRAILTALLVLVVGPPVLLALRRAARRAAFDAPVEFAEPARQPGWKPKLPP